MFLGLWGFGWSAQVKDPWIAPTVFFGVIGFGCTLGSTVSVSFVVDSYRADAGSSLTSLNFSKNLIGTAPPKHSSQQTGGFSPAMLTLGGCRVRFLVGDE